MWKNKLYEEAFLLWKTYSFGTGMSEGRISKNLIPSRLQQFCSRPRLRNSNNPLMSLWRFSIFSCRHSSSLSEAHTCLVRFVSYNNNRNVLNMYFYKFWRKMCYKMVHSLLRSSGQTHFQAYLLLFFLTFSPTGVLYSQMFVLALLLFALATYSVRPSPLPNQS